jgi:hypothetical protein
VFADARRATSDADAHPAAFAKNADVDRRAEPGFERGEELVVAQLGVREISRVAGASRMRRSRRCRRVAHRPAWRRTR